MGSWAMVFQTAPPQPASNARRTWYSELVGGADASQNGLGALTPQNSMLRSGTTTFLNHQECYSPMSLLRGAAHGSRRFVQPTGCHPWA